jgi:hypothetical protein
VAGTSVAAIVAELNNKFAAIAAEYGRPLSPKSLRQNGTPMFVVYNPPVPTAHKTFAVVVVLIKL